MTDQTSGPTGRAMTMREIREALGHNVNPQQEAETARELLYRHGLPEDVIDGALCLHAQELAALQRLRMDELDLAGQKARIVGRIVDLIDPTRAAAPAAVSAPVQPTTHADEKRRQIIAAIKASPFKELRATDHNGPLQITVNVDDLADTLLRRMAGESSPVQTTEICELPHLTIAEEDACEARRVAGEEQPATETQHTGGNAEDCPVCRPEIDKTVLYPWICQGEARQDGATT